MLPDSIINKSSPVSLFAPLTSNHYETYMKRKKYVSRLFQYMIRVWNESGTPNISRTN